MGTKEFRHAGQLPGTGQPVRSSARCIVYDHKREEVYLSTDSQRLALDVAYAQRLRDEKGDYRVYELAGNTWQEIRVKVSARPEQGGKQHPMFILLWVFASLL